MQGLVNTTDVPIGSACEFLPSDLRVVACGKSLQGRKLETQGLTNLWLNQPTRMDGFNVPSFLTEGHITYPSSYRLFLHSHENHCAKCNNHKPPSYTPPFFLKNVTCHAAPSEYSVQLCVRH
jgi:hypothetical protein